MKNNVIATAVAAVLLSTGFTSVSAAQDRQLPSGVEVITITAKRPAPTLATACVQEALTRLQGVDKTSERDTSRIELRQALQHCREQRES